MGLSFSNLTNTYPFLLVFAGGVSLVVSTLACQRRKAPGGISLAWLMFAMTAWSWSYAISWFTRGQSMAYFWQNMPFFGIVAAPLFFFCFAVTITKHSKWLSKPLMLLLAVEPLLTLFFVWTDPWHGLFFGGYRTTYSTDFTNGGPWFWINVQYSYILILAAFVILAFSWLHARAGIYRQQLGICILGLALLAIQNVLHLTGTNPLPGLDLTPVFFTFSGIIFAIGIFGFRMFDVIPVALDILVDKMSDGLIVLDDQNRILEINHSAANLIGAKQSQLVGSNLYVALKNIPELFDALSHAERSNQQIHLEMNAITQILDVSIDQMRATDGQLQGFLIVWRDVTHLTHIEEELRAANEILRDKIAEIEALEESLREQAIHDPLTGLFNRRYLSEVLDKEIARARRRKAKIAFLMIDLDHFKGVNDTYGHEAGDLVLQKMAGFLSGILRQSDIISRYGGEEFLAVLFDANAENACMRAGQIRQSLEHTPILYENHQINVTISVGVAEYPDHGSSFQTVITAADRALYQAKNSGRNRTCIGSVSVDTLVI